MGGDRFTGRLVSSWSVTTPAPPGFAQHARHQEDSPGGTTDRDDAVSGGGWQPAVWDSMPAQTVQRGELLRDEGDIGHRVGGNNHRGPEGRGAASPRVPLDSPDHFLGGHGGQTPLIGAGGAANGGLRADGAAPWMNEANVRRRADGGTVVRVAGFLMGKVYTRQSDEHRQGLHFNRPTLRGVRERKPTTADRRSLRPVGPIVPTTRQVLGGYDQTTDTLGTPPASPTVIGTEWVQ